MTAQLAVQLYTIRDFLNTQADFAKSMEKVSAMGYTAVQLSAVGAMNGETPEVDAATARKVLDDNGLKCIATHRSWEDLTNATDKEIEFHQTLGCDYTAIGGIPQSYGSRGQEGYAAFASDAAPVIARLKAGGVRFGYHNHAHELQRTGFKNGRVHTLLDVLIDAGNPDLLFELDLYWLAHGGANPERIVERCAGRIPVIHIKDKEAEGSEIFMAPIGEGNMDWDHLIPACKKAGVEWIAIEQDTCRRDPFDCLESSFKFLSDFGLK